MIRIYQAIIILFIVLFITVGCTPSEQDAISDDQLTVYTSIYPIQYAVERIGGNTVAAKTVYPPGVDAHTFEPTSKDIAAIAKSDAFFYLGAGMEGFAESAASALSSQDTTLVELGKHEELFHVEEQEHEDNHHDHSNDGHDHGDHDPHIWLDPIRMMDMSEIIKEDLIELNPEQAEIYNNNYDDLKADLIALDKKYNDVLQEKTNKKILVSHAAFGYWEERYGISQISINGLTSSNEPSQKELAKIVKQAEQHKLNYIIFEQNVSNKVSEIIQDHIGAEALTIHNLSVLTEDDLDKGEDYLSLMKYNLDILDKATK